MNTTPIKLTFLLLLFVSTNLVGQTHAHVKHEIKDKSFWSQNLITLNSDTNSSSFIIRIEEKVAPHYHNNHTEILYVVQGKAKLTMNDSTFSIREGDYIHIPPKTVHSVKVTSMEILEVISIQSPQYFGEDKIWVKSPVEE